jgi:hypothetical protein
VVGGLRTSCHVRLQECVLVCPSAGVSIRALFLVMARDVTVESSTALSATNQHLPRFSLLSVTFALCATAGCTNEIAQTARVAPAGELDCQSPGAVRLPSGGVLGEGTATPSVLVGDGYAAGAGPGLYVSARDAFRVTLNGELVVESRTAREALFVPLSLLPGQNAVSVVVAAESGTPAAVVELHELEQNVASDTSWKVSTDAESGYANADFDDTSWPQATDFGGIGALPGCEPASPFPEGSDARWIGPELGSGRNAVLRKTIRIQDGGALRGYLVGVAVRIAAFEIRKRKVRRWVGLSPTGEPPDVPIERSPPLAQRLDSTPFRNRSQRRHPRRCIPGDSALSARTQCQLRCCRGIDEPDPSSRELCRRRERVPRAFESARDRVGFSGTCGEHQAMPSGEDRRWCQRESLGRRFRSDHGEHAPCGLAQRFRTWKERRRVAVFADAEHQHVNCVGEQCFVFASRRVSIGVLGPHAVDLRRGDRHPVEQRFLRHSVVIFRMVRRNRSLIAKKNVNGEPGHGGRARKCLVHRTRRRAARETDADAAICGRYFAEKLGEPVGRSSGQLRRR